MPDASRPVGRPGLLTRADIVRVGCELGMERLRMKSVADALGTSPAALYRHIDGRWELERLVGEELLAGLSISDDPKRDASAQLVAFAVELRRFVAAHRGLATYMLVLFPRGDSGARLVREQTEALVRCGYSVESAVTVLGAVARLTVGLVAADDHRRVANDDPAFLSEHQAAHRVLGDLGELGSAYEQRWMLTDDEYFTLLITTVVNGMVLAAPPGKPLRTVVSELRSRTGEL